MKRSPPLVMVLLVIVASCCGLAGGQTREQSIGGILPRPPIVRPPATPGDAILDRVARPPAVPRGAQVPRPPAPPPSTERACVVRHIGNGEFKKECIDIAAQCEQRQCPPDSICALDLDEEIDCFPESVTQFQNCQPDFLRLSQPCPQDAGIRGFGMGCNYCVGANPFGRQAELPSARRLIGGGPLEVLPPAPIGPRACVVSSPIKKCIDISIKCDQMQCPSGTVCALDLYSSMKCFPDSVKELENCRSEQFRLSQPCPPDTGIRGFGMGCTFCVGGNPFLPGPEPPSVLMFEQGSESRRIGVPTPPPQPPSPPSIMTDRACLVVHVKDGEFKSHCVDISDKCALQNCPPGKVCGLNHDEEATCFPESVRENQNCGPEEFRLAQPCAADMGITGFGMGCTFCFGANPFMSRSLSRRQLDASPEESSTSDLACIFRHFGRGECRSIAAECEQAQCPENTVCGLDNYENITCFDASVKDFENCASEEFRLQQPCPADAGIVGYGMGCTFCGGGYPFGGEAPEPEPPVPEPVGPPTPPPGQTGAAGSSLSSSSSSYSYSPSDQPIVNRVACVSRITNAGAIRRGCMDISDLCRRRGCPADRTCALDINEQPSCFAASQLPISNCGTTRDRMVQPCPPGTRVEAFGAGCTFCRPAPTSPPPPAANAPRRACVVSGAVRRCEAIEARCADLACDETCALGLDGEPRCFVAAELPAASCGPERRRLDQPCAAGMTAVAFGAGCTYCRPL